MTGSHEQPASESLETRARTYLHDLTAPLASTCALMRAALDGASQQLAAQPAAQERVANHQRPGWDAQAWIAWGRRNGVKENFLTYGRMDGAQGEAEPFGMSLMSALVQSADFHPDDRIAMVWDTEDEIPGDTR